MPVDEPTVNVWRRPFTVPPKLVAFAAAVTGIVLIVIGTFRSAYLFDRDAAEHLGSRWLILVGCAPILLAAIVWWRLGRRLPATVVAGPAVAAAVIAYASPGALFFVAMGYPLAGIVGLVAAVGVSTAGDGDRTFPLYAVLAVCALALSIEGLPFATPVAVAVVLGIAFVLSARRARRRRDARTRSVTPPAAGARTER